MFKVLIIGEYGKSYSTRQDSSPTCDCGRGACPAGVIDILPGIKIFQCDNDVCEFIKVEIEGDPVSATKRLADALVELSYLKSQASE